MVILAPIDQLGWRSASAGVARAKRSALQVRNGPPDAVSTIVSMLSGSAPASACNAAECSLSTGRSSVPASATAAMNTSPADTRHSLLASARRRPCRAASNVGSSPAAPTIAASTQSAGSAAAAMTAAGPAATLVAGPGKQRLELTVELWIADHGEAGVGLARGLGELGDAALRGDCHDLEAHRGGAR